MLFCKRERGGGRCPCPFRKPWPIKINTFILLWFHRFAPKQIFYYAYKLILIFLIIMWKIYFRLTFDKFYLIRLRRYFLSKIPSENDGRIWPKTCGWLCNLLQNIEGKYRWMHLNHIMGQCTIFSGILKSSLFLSRYLWNVCVNLS